MNESNHTKHRYSGAPGEKVTINVTPQNTTSLVTYTLDGVSGALAPGSPLTFELKDSSGDMTPLQLTMDFNALGSYQIVIENVVDCVKDSEHTGQCVHQRPGPPQVIENYRFFVA
jgi:hypothetical protein